MTLDVGGVDVVTEVAVALDGFGGELRCTVCGAVTELGNVAQRLRHGWPKHCGYTMRWVTAREMMRERGHRG